MVPARTSDTPLERDPEAAAAQAGNVPVFDIREARERLGGWVRGAKPLDAAKPAEQLTALGVQRQGDLLLCCATGRRSLELARSLRAAGWKHAASIRGGFAAWRAAGLPCEFPAGLDADAAERYARQLVLDGVGPEGQARLRNAGVLLIGAGGLGSPAALYLAAAGVGRIGLVDPDLVERSNLQRQILHADADAGEAKAASAHKRLAALNPTVSIQPLEERLERHNAVRLLRGWDVVLDGSDNLATRYAVNAACVALGLPLVYAAVSAFEGQLGVFHPAAAPGSNPCYQCLYPASNGERAIADCAVAGVLGVLPGLLGTLMATECLKLLLGIGRTMTGRLLLVDALELRFREIQVAADPQCPVCGPGTAGA